jgi:hypothetical protein
MASSCIQAAELTLLLRSSQRLCPNLAVGRGEVGPEEKWFDSCRSVPR